MQAIQCNSCKKKLAFLLACAPNLAFAAGNVALSLNKYMNRDDYDIIIYYLELSESDRQVFQKIPYVKLNQSASPQDFSLACFDIFKLLEKYIQVVWLDFNITIHDDLTEITRYKGFALSYGDHTIKEQFSKPMESYDMNKNSVSTSVMIVEDTLRYKEIYKWCHKKIAEYAEFLRNPVQGILDISLQKFNINPSIMPYYEWQPSIFEKDAIIAKMSCFGDSPWKPWNTPLIVRYFPEWYRMHIKWLQLGGSDFPERVSMDLTNNLTKSMLIENVNDSKNTPKFFCLVHTRDSKYIKICGLQIFKITKSGHGTIMAFDVKLQKPNLTICTIIKELSGANYVIYIKQLSSTLAKYTYTIENNKIIKCLILFNKIPLYKRIHEAKA